MSKLIAPVQPLILKTAGQLPTIPVPNTIMPDDPRFNIESDLMVGQFAYNVIDDIWYYRGYSSILPLNQSTKISADQVEVWQSNKLYSAGNVYVSYVNPSSPNEQFHIEAIYRCIIDALAGESPESHPNKWEYQGQYVDLSYIKFTDLQDTPENYTGHNNKVLVVNAAGDKIEFTADIKNLSSVQFDLGSVETITEGKLKWNSIDGTLDLGLPGGQSVLQIGQETVIRANNAETFPILNGQAVYISGSTGTRVEIKLATASDSSKTQVVGIATQNINPGSSGYVTLVGLVRGLNTLGMSYGVPVWLDTTNGGITQTVPQAPNISVFIGYVVTVHATEGVLFVRPTTIPRLSSLSDVKDTPLTESGQIPVWDNVQGYFDFTRNIEDYALTEDIITSHNDLNDIQGGTTGEYYHLTQAEYESLGATPGHTIVDSSTTYPQRSKLKFIGGVTVSDDSVNDITEISVIPTSTSAWEADTGNDEWGQIKDNHIKPKSSKKVHVEHIDKLADEEIRIYGYLYKWYTITDYRGFTSGGNWRVPTKADWENLLTFIGSNPGTKLKSTTGWNINTGTDTHNFKMLPGGVRSITAGASIFALEGTNAYQWASTEAVLPSDAEIFTFSDSSSNVFNGTISKKAGCSVRLVRPATDTELNFPDGQFVIAPYIGNNGRRYKTVKMGTLVWTAENLIETHLADGSEIPDLTSPLGWNLNDTGGRCSYDNLEYVYAFYNIRGKLHKVAITGSYLDLYNLPEGGTGGSSTIPMNYQSRIVGANTVDIPLNEMVTIQDDLLDTDSVTITLNSFLVPISNQYTLHISTGDTVPNVTHPIGTIWQNGAEPELSPNRKYTFVYEYVQVESGDWKIYGVAGEFHSEGPTSGYVTEAPIDNKLYGRKDGAWEEITDIGGASSHTELTGKNDEEEFQHIELADKTKIVGLIDKIDPVLGVSTKFLNEKGDFVPVATTAIGVQGRDFFARSINSDIVGYKTLSNDAGSSESIVSITAQSSDGIIWGDKYLTDAFVDGKTIRSAAWGFDYWRLVSSVVGVSRKHLRVFIYRGGVEIDILTLQSPEIDDTEFTERQVSYVFQEVVLQPNDRLGIQEGFSTTHDTNITFQYIIGDGRGWFMRIPLDLEHKDTTNKNGESAFQHVTLTEKNNYNAHINGVDESKHGANQVELDSEESVQDAMDRIDNYALEFAFSDETTALSASNTVAKFTKLIEQAFALTTPVIDLNTAPTGSIAIFDIKKNGTSIFSTTPTIDVTEFTTRTAATPPVLTTSPTNWSVGDKLELFVLQTGSTIAGAGGKAALKGKLL